MNTSPPSEAAADDPFTGEVLGRVAAIIRYPVKSMAGETLQCIGVDRRGLVGDRLWAVRSPDGKLGSGKNRKRFRRMPGLLDLSASYEGTLPVVEFPDGRRLSGEHPEIHAALSAHLGRPVTLAREERSSHFDIAPLHMVTTASLSRLSETHTSPVDPRRLRANIIVDTGPLMRFDEPDWLGRQVRIGREVTARVRGPMVRCVMVNLPQAELGPDKQLLKSIGSVNNGQLGLIVDVVRPGNLKVGDAVVAVLT